MVLGKPIKLIIQSKQALLYPLIVVKLFEIKCKIHIHTLQSFKKKEKS